MNEVNKEIKKIEKKKRIKEKQEKAKQEIKKLLKSFVAFFRKLSKKTLLFIVLGIFIFISILVLFSVFFGDNDFETHIELMKKGQANEYTREKAMKYVFEKYKKKLNIDEIINSELEIAYICDRDAQNAKKQYTKYENFKKITDILDSRYKVNADNIYYGTDSMMKKNILYFFCDEKNDFTTLVQYLNAIEYLPIPSEDFKRYERLDYLFEKSK